MVYCGASAKAPFGKTPFGSSFPLGGVFGLAFGPSVSRSKTMILDFPVVLTLVILRLPPPPKKKETTFGSPKKLTPARAHLRGHTYIRLIRSISEISSCFCGRDPGTLKSDIVSKKHPQLICSDLRLKLKIRRLKL